METIGLFLLIILSGIALTALFLLLDVFFPKRIRLAQESAETFPRRSFLLGLVNFFFMAALIIAFIALGDSMIYLGAIISEVFYFPALLIIFILAIGIIFGLSVTAQIVGKRLFPDLAPIKQKAWGTGMLILACLTPFVGWFAFLPFVALFGLGSLIGSWFPPKVKEKLKRQE